jgi:hypothetical protein
VGSIRKGGGNMGDDFIGGAIGIATFLAIVAAILSGAL